MFRRLLNIAMVLAVASLVAFMAKASLGPSPSNPRNQIVIFDRPVPWPWGFEMPFPWSDVQGMWKVADADFNSYFVLKVVRSKDSGQRLLVVRQIDPDTCKITATGVGYESARVVRAQMTSDEGVTYRIAVRAFAKEDSPRPAVGKGDESQVMVLSILDMDAATTLPIHVQIGKVANSIDLKGCTNSQK
jgi:hypothetical protein